MRVEFEQPGSVPGDGTIRLRGQLIRVGTDLAYEVGVEEGKAPGAGKPIRFTARVTNNLPPREWGVEDDLPPC